MHDAVRKDRRSVSPVGAAGEDGADGSPQAAGRDRKSFMDPASRQRFNEQVSSAFQTSAMDRFADDRYTQTPNPNPDPYPDPDQARCADSSQRCSPTRPCCASACCSCRPRSPLLHHLTMLLLQAAQPLAMLHHLTMLHRLTMPHRFTTGCGRPSRRARRASAPRSSPRDTRPPTRSSLTNPTRAGACRGSVKVPLEEAGPLGAPPLPRVLESAGFNAADFAAFGPSGAAPRRRQARVGRHVCDGRARRLRRRLRGRRRCEPARRLCEVA